MSTRLDPWIRNLLIGCVYAVGLVGILASHGDNDDDDDREDTACELVVRSIAPTVDSSGDIWIAVTAIQGRDSFDNIIRLLDDGSVAANFSIDQAGLSGNALAVAMSTDGSGDVYAVGEFGDRVIRLNGDAIPNDDFNSGAGFNDTAWSLAVADDGTGQIYVGGGFTEYNASLANGLVRLNGDGTLDLAFDPPEVSANAIALSLDGSGDIYVEGLGTGAGRLNSDGTLDALFSFVGGFDLVRDIAPAVDGTFDVFMGGATNRLKRVEDDGDDVPLFIVGAGFDADPYDIEPTGDGSGTFYVVGPFSMYNGNPSPGVARINSDGVFDVNFIVGEGFSSLDGISVFSVERATDGTSDIYVGGQFTDYAGTPVNGIVRLNADGTLDTEFAVEVEINELECNNGSNQ